MMDPSFSDNEPKADQGNESNYFDLSPDLSPELLHKTALAIGIAKHLMTQVSVEDWIVNPEDPKKIIIGESPIVISFDYSSNHNDPVIRIKTPDYDIEIAPGNPWVQELPSLAALLCKEYYIESAKDALDALEMDWQDLRDSESSFVINKSLVCRKLPDGYSHSEITEQEVSLQRGEGVLSLVDQDSVNYRQVSVPEYRSLFAKEKLSLFDKFSLVLPKNDPKGREKFLGILEERTREETTRKFCDEVPESLGPRNTNMIYSNTKLEGMLTLFGGDFIKIRYEVDPEVIIETINRMKHWSVNIVSRRFLFVDETAPKD